MEFCKSCNTPQASPVGYTDFIDGYCEACHDRREKGRIEAEDLDYDAQDRRAYREELLDRPRPSDY